MTLEATISAAAKVPPNSDIENGKTTKSEVRGIPYLPYAAIALCLISLASILFIRARTLHHIALAREEGSLLQGSVKTLSRQAAELESKLRKQQIEEKQAGPKAASEVQFATPLSRSTQNQAPTAPVPAAIQTQRPVGGSQTNPKYPAAYTENAVQASSPVPTTPEVKISQMLNDPTGDPLADYNRARAMSDPQGEDWFHRHYACRGLSCKNLDEWKLDPAAKLVFEASSYGKFEALQDGTQTLVFPAFNVDYGPARGSLEGVFLYPEPSGDEVRLLSPAVVEGGGERWTLRKPGAFQHG